MKLTKEDVTAAVKTSVNAYLLARTYAEVMKEKVDKVYAEIFKEYPLYADRDNGERIYDHVNMYLSKDEDACAVIYAEANKRLRSASIKPDTMGDEYCPALVAGHLQIKAEQCVVEAAAEMLKEKDAEEFRDNLLCAGMKTYHKFIDLVVGLVVNLPDYVAPAIA